MKIIEFKYSQVVALLKEIDPLFVELDNSNIDNNIGFALSSSKNKIESGLYFLTNEYSSEADTIYNSLILVDYVPEKKDTNIYIKVKNPQLAHYKISASIEKKNAPGIHVTAIISPDAQIAASAYIGPFCIVGNCIIEDNVSLLGHITISDNVVIKQNTEIEANSLIGARGMAWIWDEDGTRVMQPQLGGVIIEEDCLLGSDISIVRGSLSENTIVGKGTVMAHGTKIGHGSVIGKYVHLANNVSLAGNAQIGDRVFLGSACVVSPNVFIAEGCIVGAGSVVNKSVHEPHSTIVGVPGKVINKDNFEYKPKGAPKPFKNK
ncbi:MAG: DapH/DapD/GlmU-related protein [Bacteroidota bacterium]|nr:DapH/DapD/GlmU-related protein [Bacteroidota bacterium]